ncbi:class I SAM-dependent methyltransferase [Litoribrevibacter euphylliae]|uniref:Class I SAM-dependent methyltransferase n=1 Tax=Litoribrevibacter euphylliae TaxID=1834034 RepID=A0ABV7HGT3_9GAMM
MTQQSGAMEDHLYTYLLEKGTREEPLLRNLRDETAKDPMARMQISPEQGQFMKFMVSLLQPRKIVEVGTFTGYSSLCMALASDDSCLITTCDLDENWTSVAKRYWQQAGVDHKIHLKLGQALDSLDELLETGHTGSFDLAFLDADKENYPAYYEKLKKLLKLGGVLFIDNVFWGGKVADPTDNTEPTQGVRKLNDLLHQDVDMEISMIPISDGLTLAKKIR